MLDLTGDLVAGLRGLERDVQDKVVRSAAHAGALVFYDEAKHLAPVYAGPARPGIKPGQLRNAIYRVYSNDLSTPERAVYQVSWNASKAPHGHLIEYGHWRVNKVVATPTGWRGLSERLATPVWVPGVAFIRRAGDRANDAAQAMRARAAERLREVVSRTIVDDFGNEVDMGTSE